MSTTAPTLGNRLRDLFRRPAKVDAAPALTASVRPSGRMPLDSSAVLARYEAGQMGGMNRSWLHAYVQDARQDITPGERLEMVRKSRYFERNNATEQKILDLIEVNVIGTGVHATPASSNADWNQRALAWWEEWCWFADLTSRQSFATLQALIARAQAVDGEIFVWLTYGDIDEQGRRFPRIQLIETHRVCEAKLPAQYQKEGFNQYDGILTDARGRPVFYIVSNDNDAFSKTAPKSVALIPAEEMVHVYEPSRTSQPRGIPLFHACLHDLHDLDDLQQYEMLASKDAASRANIVKTKSGEFTESNPIGNEEVSVSADGSIAEKITYYNQAFGGRTVVMEHGDEHTQSTALRPTSAQQEFWKILERKVCRGTGISYAALCDYEGSWGGAALRGALAADNRFYDVRTQTLTTAFQLIWNHVIGSQVKPGGALSVDVPKDWRKVTWQSPRRATVDIGRESKSIIEELKLGIRTERDIQGELGLDSDEILRRRTEEILARVKAARRIEKETGVSLREACSFLGLSAPPGTSLPDETDAAPSATPDDSPNPPAPTQAAA